ncbi:MAG: M28 family peptidase [Fimbriimonadaceae bacterium]
MTFLALVLAFPQSVSAVNLEAHVKFLASDELEGRNTPSAGLDKAAAYIAEQFKAIGLEPGVKDSYFQVTDFTNRRTSTTAKVSNVIGVLRGTDPVLRDTYIIVTGHYDHLGMSTAEGEGDKIFNGANDDASGVAGVIESARALVKAKPKRSVIFMTVYGEEKGLVGSTYYCKNPVFPLKQTIANLNLEQIGRTDDNEGPRVDAFNLTGFDFTDLPRFLGPAATASGVKIEKHPSFSDAFFDRSDNRAFALAGIPSGTISTCYMFPDYHKVTDHWDKLHYANMVKVVNGIIGGVLAIANSTEPVKWIESEKTKRYLDAYKTLMGGK